MSRGFGRRIGPFVRTELQEAQRARVRSQPEREFRHLERAHVIGQASTYWHVRVHWEMLLWGVRNHSLREVVGQIPRIIAAAMKTAIGWVPEGNTGGSYVSPFRPMPIDPELAKIIRDNKPPPSG